MKKIIIALLALILTLSFVSCGETASDSATTSADSAATTEAPVQTEFKIGETWTVEGQWEVTINGVTETADRNEYSDKTPAAVYIVDYTYTNLGYERDGDDGLYINLEDTIVDSENTLGYSYPGDITYYPQETPTGVTCNAQVCIGVDHAGTFKIMFEKYDKNVDKQKATFIVEP